MPDVVEKYFMQHKGGLLGNYGGNEERQLQTLLFDANVAASITCVLGDMDAKIAFVEDVSE